MKTRRTPPARPVNKLRVFAVRLTKDDETTLDHARQRMASTLGDTPSNPLFLETLLNFYLDGTRREIDALAIEPVSALDI